MEIELLLVFDVGGLKAFKTSAGRLRSKNKLLKCRKTVKSKGALKNYLCSSVIICFVPSSARFNPTLAAGGTANSLSWLLLGPLSKRVSTFAFDGIITSLQFF